MNYTETAAQIVAKLNPFAVAYALDTARGDFRGFAALHDLFDANELLPAEIAEADDTAARMETLNALLAEIDRQLLSMTPRPPAQEWTSDALDHSERERMLTVECGPWSVVCTSYELEAFETFEGEEEPEDYDPETMAAPRFCRFLDYLAEQGALSFHPAPPAVFAIPLPALAMAVAGFVNDDTRHAAARAIAAAGYNHGMTEEQAAEFARLCGLPAHCTLPRAHVLPA